MRIVSYFSSKIFLLVLFIYLSIVINKLKLFYLNELGSHKYWCDKLHILTWKPKEQLSLENEE